MFTTLDDLEQGSEEWLVWRSARIGSSDAPIIMGENKWKSKQYLLDEKLGNKPIFRGNLHTRRGQQLEPLARDAYQRLKKIQLMPSVLQSSSRAWQSASIDGINLNGQVVIEIKCGDKAYEYSLKSNKVPDYYYGQIQHILCVTGYSSLDYFCWLPNLDPILIKVPRDESYITRLLKEEFSFYCLLQEALTEKNVVRSASLKSNLDLNNYSGEFKNGLYHGYGVYKLANGNVYEGHWINGEKSGHGIFKWANGDVYEGGWSEDKRSGHGLEKWRTGGQYEGDFRNGLKHGHGVNIWPNGNVYDGNWINGEKSGHGIHKWINEGIYEGSWSEDKRCGHGSEKWHDGSEYEGSFSNGLKHGHGMYKSANGDVYEGHWIDGKRSGHGIFKWANGDVYEGHWIDGKRSGHGIYKWASRVQYVGNFVNDQMHGRGSYSSASGAEYLGIWQNDILDRYCEFRDLEGNHYVGDFKKREFHGQGLFTWENGAKYLGGFVDGFREGSGRFISVDKKNYSGKWRQGVLEDLFSNWIENRAKKFTPKYKKLLILKEYYESYLKKWDGFNPESPKNHNSVDKFYKEKDLLVDKIDFTLADFDLFVENFEIEISECFFCCCEDSYIDMIEEKFNERIEHITNLRDELYLVYRQFV